MYEDLVNALRETRETVRRHSEVAMYVPPYQLSAAADAIEELSRAAEVNAKRALKWAADAEKAEEKLRWIPVTEQLPLRGDRVICFGDNGINIVDFVCGDKWCALPWFYLDGEQETGVTHWMQIPQPPKEGE